MKALYKEKIGKYTIYTHVADAPVDPEATKQKVETMIKPEMTEKDVEKLYMDNLVYSNVGPEADLVEDNVGEEVQEKLAAKGKNRLLLTNRQYIADYRDTEYWIKKSGKWEKEKIEEFGVELLPSAVLQENLSREQQEEISAQQEEERINNLSPEQKAEEKSNRLHAIAREALNRAAESELLGETFDKQAWIKPKKAEIEKLYRGKKE